ALFSKPYIKLIIGTQEEMLNSLPSKARFIIEQVVINGVPEEIVAQMRNPILYRILLFCCSLIPKNYRFLSVKNSFV
ncbi:hypothetical protein ABEX46_22880, partial [Brevibacillus agri]